LPFFGEFCARAEVTDCDFVASYSSSQDQGRFVMRRRSSRAVWRGNDRSIKSLLLCCSQQLRDEFLDVGIGELVVGIVLVDFLGKFSVGGKDQDDGNGLDVPFVPPGLLLVFNHVIGELGLMFFLKLKRRRSLFRLIHRDRHTDDAVAGVPVAERDELGKFLCARHAPGGPGCPPRRFPLFALREPRPTVCN
jgi:hypothetical protein